MQEPRFAKAPDAFRTISEVADDLDLPQHVLRFWETRFNQIKPMKRGGGRRYYRPEDVDLLRGIRLLLYSEGFTIRGVQRLLKEKGLGFVVAVGQTGSVQTVTAAEEGALSAPERREPLPRPEPLREPVLDDDDDEVAIDAFETEAPEPAEQEPSYAAPPPPRFAEAPPQPTAPPGLTRDQRRAMESVLADLVEAKRLVDQVR